MYGTVHLLLPLDTLQTREEEDCSLTSLAAPLSLSSKNQQDPQPWPTTIWKNRGDKPCGQLPNGRLATLSLRHYWTKVVDLSPPFPPYKYQGTREERRRKTGERTKEGRKKKNRGKHRKEKKGKQKRKTEKNKKEQQQKKEKEKQQTKKTENERRKAVFLSLFLLLLAASPSLFFLLTATSITVSHRRSASPSPSSSSPPQSSLFY